MRIAPDKRSAVRGNEVMNYSPLSTVRGLARRTVERGELLLGARGYPGRQSLRSFALG
jgi:hypothetical protein